MMSLVPADQLEVISRRVADRIVETLLIPSNPSQIANEKPGRGTVENFLWRRCSPGIPDLFAAFDEFRDP